MMYRLALRVPTANTIITKGSQITMYSKPDIYLVSSILLETLSTACLKKTILNNIWYIPVYLGYAVSFYIFPKALTKFSLSTAYTIWCGVGIILTLLIDTYLYNEILTLRKLIGVLIIIAGIKTVK